MAIRKRGKFYYFRGTIPAKQADGSIARIRHEESLKTVSRVDALKRAADLERHYWTLAYNPPKPSGPTFAQAALVYIETRQRSDRFITKLIEYFGDTPLDEIDQAKATEAASKLYPGWKNSSLNRAIYTPLSAIGVKGLRRPSEQNTNRGIPIPDEDWFDRVFVHAPPKLAALLTFLTLTGRRVGEALALTEKDVDEDGRVNIGRTKTGTSVSVQLPGLCRHYLSVDSRVLYRSRRLFGYSSLQAASVALRRTCERAGVPYYSFHKCGRHSFATRCLRAGWSLKEVAEAGGWAGIGVVASRYIHLEQQDVQRRVEELGAKWSRRRKTWWRGCVSKT